MKTKYNFLKAIFSWTLLAGWCFMAVSCQEDKIMTTGMPENQLINEIVLKVSDELPMLVGSDSTIKFSISPNDATNPRVRWVSYDESVAVVSQQGKITAVSVGEAVIAVTPEIGFGPAEATATITVKVVSEVVKATSIKITTKNYDDTPLSQIYEKDKVQLTYEILPANHTYSHVTWSSGDESIATVTETGLVTGIKPGNVVIYGETHEPGGGIKQAVNLTIIPYIAVTDVTIEPYDKIMTMNEVVNLSYTYTPSDAAAGSVVWSSSAENIVKVDYKGQLKAVGFGVAVITATCKENDNSASITVTVEEGRYMWDKVYGFDRWITPTAGAKCEVKNGRLLMTLSSGAKRRADIKYGQNIGLHIGKNPVFAMRCTVAKGGNNILDLVSTPANIAAPASAKCNDGITLDDGTRLIYFDISAFNLFPLTAMEQFRTFAMKIADIPQANTTDTYEIYWIGTFHSIAEMQDYANAQVAAGN